MYLGDNLLRAGSRAWWSSSRPRSPTRSSSSSTSTTRALSASPSSTAKVVVQLEEKPAEPKSDLALVGVYMFQPGIFQICRALEPSGRGEYEITEAIQALIDQGKRVEPHVVTGWWKDTGKWEDMLETNRLLLDVVEPVIDGEVADSDLDGRVPSPRGRWSSAAASRGRSRSERARC